MSKEYKRGDTLLISSPFVHVLSSKERATRCGQCFTKCVMCEIETETETETSHFEHQVKDDHQS